MRQHLTAVLAAQRVCGGQVDGATVGSTALRFVPGPVVPGDHSFSIGTAGSTTLVLQTLLPVLVTAAGPSALTLEGGTHNIHAPTIHFLQRAFVPLLERMGPRVEVRLERYGFYPAGGGRVRVSVTPSHHLEPIELMERGEITHRRAIASVARLPEDIARRELAVVARSLGWAHDALRIEQLEDVTGPGNVLSIEVGSESILEVFTGFGRKGVPAEHVARDAVEEVRDYLARGMPVGPHLADQLMLPLALAGAGRYRTGPLTTHAETNARVIERFLDVAIGREANGPVTTISVSSR